MNGSRADETIDKVMRYTAYASKAKATTVSLGIHGTPQFFVCVEGSEFIVCIKIEGSESMEDEIKTLSTANANQVLKQMQEENNGAALLTKGSCMCVPAGFFILTYTVEAGTIISRKSFLRDDAAEEQLVLKMVTQMLEANVALRTTLWNDFHKVLSASPARVD